MRRRRIFLGAVVVVFIALISAAVVAIRNAVVYQEMLETVEVSTFYPGITIDGIDVSGMTLQQAAQSWAQKESELRAAYGVSIVADDKTFSVDDELAGLSFNAQEIIEDAFSIGREGTLDERYYVTQQLKELGRDYQTTMQYDLLPVRDAIVAFCEENSDFPVNSEIQEFDFSEREFIFTESRGGRVANIDEIADAAIRLLENGEYGQTLTATYSNAEPTVTGEQLSAIYGRRASYESTAKNDRDRNKNISLAVAAVTKTILQPGEEFSFNQATGERTEEKGYKAAGAIKNGVLIEEPGGGVCQVSSTLFNAVVRADLEITERHEHSWPSGYVPLGEDAMVDYPNKDFKFVNNTDSPIYIVMRFGDRELRAYIYGEKLKDDIKIELRTDITDTYEPDAPDVSTNRSLEQGEIVTIRAQRTGYRANTFKVYYDAQGEVIKEVDLHRSSYRAIQGIYEKGSNTKFVLPDN